MALFAKDAATLRRFVPGRKLRELTEIWGKGANTNFLEPL